MSEIRHPTHLNAGPGELRWDEPMPSVNRSQGRRWRCQDCPWTALGEYVAKQHAYETGHVVVRAGRAVPWNAT